MDIFIPFIYDKEEDNNFEQLSLYIDEPIIIDEEDDYQEEEDTTIIIEIM